MNSIYQAACIARDVHKDDTINGKDYFEHRILPVVNYVHQHFGTKNEIIKLLCVAYLSEVVESFKTAEDADVLNRFSEDVITAITTLSRWNIHEIKETQDVLVRCVFEAVCRVEMDEYISVADFESAKYYLNCLCLMRNPNNDH